MFNSNWRRGGLDCVEKVRVTETQVFRYFDNLPQGPNNNNNNNNNNKNNNSNFLLIQLVKLRLTQTHKSSNQHRNLWSEARLPSTTKPLEIYRAGFVGLNTWWFNTRTGK